MELSISGETFRHHVVKFWRSLQSFPEFYLPVFFEKVEFLPEHIAYICPLCLKNGMLFFKEGNFINSDFNIDHYPPQSVGGRDFVLVCKDCNNNAGTSYDHSLKEKAAFLAFSKGKPGSEMSILTEISNLKGKFKSKLTVDTNGQLQIGLKRKGKRVKPLDEWLKTSKGNKEWEMTLTYFEPKPDIVKKALLKSAYLNCFAHWGYDFALSLSGQKMREAITGAIEYGFPDVALLWIDDTPEMPAGICLMKNEQWESYVANLPLLVKDFGYKVIATVLIPQPGINGWEYLSKFEGFFRNAESHYMSFTPLPPEL